ncbi:hypothetical protein CVO76_06490, partial [Arthrobacter agilis]
MSTSEHDGAASPGENRPQGEVPPAPGLPLPVSGVRPPLPAERLVVAGQQFSQPQYTDNFYEAIGGAEGADI